MWKAEADDICGYDGTILVAVKTVKVSHSAHAWFVRLYSIMYSKCVKVVQSDIRIFWCRVR